MNGRMIAGLERWDPEVVRLEAEVQRLTRQGTSAAPGAYLTKINTASLDQLKKVLESRKRMAVKRSQLAQSKRPMVDALDAMNAREEARELARRMKGAGYTDAQIQATVRPMLVDPEGTVTGRKERKAKRRARRQARKKAGKGIFRKIGKALKKAGGFVFKGLAKLNPVLAGARVAVLSLVRKNAGGMADAMRKKGAEKMRKKWEALGGDFSKLQKAVEKGAGQRITGLVGNLPAPDEDNDIPPGEDEGAPAEGGKDGKSGLDKLWELAKPIIIKILGPLGIAIDGAGKDTKVRVAEGGPVERRLAAELKRALARADSDITKAVQGQADDAENPNTGGGPGHNGGGATVSPMVLAGLAAALIFVTSKR